MFQKRIHVFKAGDQTSAQGVQRKFSEKDLQQVIDTYNPTIHEAPLVIGHAGDNDSTPAYGWIQGFSKQGSNLYADVAFTDTARDLVKDGHYRKVSISFYSPDSAINPHKGKWTARHLALLGASPPAVKGLEPFSFAEEEGVYDFAVTLSPSDIFDEELGPTLIVEKSPLEMLREKLDEVREDVSSAVQELQTSQEDQTAKQLGDAAESSVTEQPEASQMANPDAAQFTEHSNNVGRKSTEIAQQTADLETQFPEEEFMEKGKISRKHAKGAHGQVMQVVENVYEEAHKESTAERKEAADRGLERKRQLKEGKKGEAHETGELMKMDDKKLSDDHKEYKQGYGDRLDESLGAKDGKESTKKQSMKDRRDESDSMEKSMGKRKYAGDKSMDHAEPFGRDETARSDSDGYAQRMAVAKEGPSGDTGRFKTAKSSEQDEDREHTAKSSEQEEDRKKTAKSGEFGKGDTGRWAGQQEDGYDKVHNDDQYDLATDEYPETSRPQISEGTDPYGRKETETKIPVETEEMPDDEVFAVDVTNVMSDKNMRVMRQTSSDGRKSPVGGPVTHAFAEEEDADFGEGAGKTSKHKMLTPGGMDDPDEAAETVGPDGAYAETRGEKKSKEKQLTTGAMDTVDDPAETVGPSGAYSEEHGECEDPHTPTGYGSTYEEMDDEEGGKVKVSKAVADHAEGEEDTVDHSCGDMNYGMGSMNNPRPMGLDMAEKMKAELDKLKAEHAELQRMYMEKEIANRKSKIHNFVEGLYEEGRLTDGVMPQEELLSYCEGLEFGTLEFSEGETAATRLLGLLAKLPPMVSFGEVAGGTFQYSEQDLDPHAKALQMVEQSEGKVDYVEALKRSMFS